MIPKSRIIALASAGVLVLTALLISYVRNKSVPSAYAPNVVHELGKAGSEHAHQSMLIFINGKPLDFSQSRYQVKSELVHFEDGDGVYIHKHAVGVTLPLFLETLNIKLTTNCLRLDTGLEYCSDETGTLSTYLNNKLYTKWNRYELKQDDKILIDYSKGSTPNDIKLRMNAIPDIPSDL